MNTNSKISQFPGKWLIILLAIIFIQACKKHESELTPYVPPPVVEPLPDQPGEYIKGYFGEELLNYTQPLAGLDTFSNVFYYGPNQLQINMLRSDKNKPLRSIQIYLAAAQLDSLNLPVEFYQQQKQTGFGNIQLIDASKEVINMFGPTDAYNYSGVTFEDLRLKLVDKSNDTLRGFFEGKIKTATGLTKKVTRGRFKIKIIRVQTF